MAAPSPAAVGPESRVAGRPQTRTLTEPMSGRQITTCTSRADSRCRHRGLAEGTQRQPPSVDALLAALTATLSMGTSPSAGVGGYVRATAVGRRGRRLRRPPAILTCYQEDNRLGPRQVDGNRRGSYTIGLMMLAHLDSPFWAYPPGTLRPAPAARTARAAFRMFDELRQVDGGPGVACSA